MRFADCYSPLTMTTAPALKQAGFDGVCRYLWPDGKGLTPTEVTILDSVGLKIVSNFEGNPTSQGYFNRVQVRRDASTALTQARRVGQPLHTPIYFSVDYDAQPADFPRILAYFQGVYTSLHAYYDVRAYAKAELLTYLYDHLHWMGPGWEPAAWDNGVVEEGIALFQDRYNISIRGLIQVDEDLVKGANVGWWSPAKGVRNTLQQGDSGAVVKALQAHLNEVLGTKIAVDGIYGPDTAAAVKSFQVIAHLTPSGAVGQSTQAALDNRLKAQEQKSEAAVEQAREDKVKHALSLLAEAETIIKSL